jgi:hypothetical protein
VPDTLEKTLRENADYYRLQEQETLAALTGLPRGSIKTKRSEGRTYYYLQYREGGKVVQRYLGRAYPEDLAALVERRRKLKSRLVEIRRALKILGRKKDEDLLAPVGALIAALAELGLWEDGAEIVGSWCFRIYQLYLGVRSYPVRTDDIDILLPLPWRGRALNIDELLRQLGFAEHFSSDGSTFYARPGLRVEFLSPKKRGRRSRSAGPGVTPQELAFLELLLERPLTIKLMAGVSVRVPAPGAFVIHKLLVARRRKSADKRQKDLIQALSVARFMLAREERRADLVEVWESTLPSWRKKVLSSVRLAREEFPLEEGVIDGLEELLGT